jgi:hypothetical protein
MLQVMDVGVIKSCNEGLLNGQEAPKMWHDVAFLVHDALDLITATTITRAWAKLRAIASCCRSNINQCHNKLRAC